MNSQTDVSKKDMVFGSVLGGIVGGLTVWLACQQSNNESGKTISNQISRVKDMRNTAKETMDDVASVAKEKSSTISDSILEQGEHLSQKALSVIQKVKKDNDVRLDDLKVAVKEIMQEEMETGKEIRQIIKSEIKNAQEKVNNDMNEFKKELGKEFKETFDNSK